jgi:hypothetical protein
MPCQSGNRLSDPVRNKSAEQLAQVLALRDPRFTL